MTEVKCRISTVHRVSEDMLLIAIDPNKKVQVKDVIELKKAALKIGDGKPFYNLVSVGPFTLPTRKAREVSCSVEGSYYKLGEAFVVKTLPQRLICRVLIKLNKPTVPTQCFETIQEAKQWLRALRAERKLQSVF